MFMYFGFLSASGEEASFAVSILSFDSIICSVGFGISPNSSKSLSASDSSVM